MRASIPEQPRAEGPQERKPRANAPLSRSLKPEKGNAPGRAFARQALPGWFANCWRRLRVLSAALVLWHTCPWGTAQTLSDSTLAQIRFEQKLNAQVSLLLPFRDEAGKPVQLSRYFDGKPVVLVLGYYECPMLCTLVLNGMVESAADMKWSIGQEFQVVDVSIDPNETPTLAAEKKRSYLKRYGRSSAAAGWHFLTGSESSIRELTKEVGFAYVYDPVSKQFAHPSGLVVLTPEGKVSRYLFGVTYSPKDLYGALKDASSHQVGSPIQQLILLCFHYNPITGKYSRTIIVVLRALGIATMLGFLWLIVILVRRGKAAERSLAAAPRTTNALTRPPVTPEATAQEQTRL